MLLITENEKQDLKKLIEEYIAFVNERDGFSWADNLPTVAYRFIDIDKMLELYK